MLNTIYFSRKFRDNEKTKSIFCGLNLLDFQTHLLYLRALLLILGFVRFMPTLFKIKVQQTHVTY